MSNESTPLVSIVVLVHNGLSYARLLLEDRRTEGVAAEWIVFDNASDEETAAYVRSLEGRPNLKLLHSDKNLYFCRGNNEAAKEAEGQYLLLLNSDVRINDPSWLVRLLGIHKRGATGLGVLRSPLRSDGFCFLIDRDLYGDGLDAERFDWWWGITEFQARLLRQGFEVQAIKSHPQLTHFRGGSGKPPETLRGMHTNSAVVASWFKGLPPVNVVNSL